MNLDPGNRWAKAQKARVSKIRNVARRPPVTRTLDEVPRETAAISRDWHPNCQDPHIRGPFPALRRSSYPYWISSGFRGDAIRNSTRALRFPGRASRPLGTGNPPAPSDHPVAGTNERGNPVPTAARRRGDGPGRRRRVPRLGPRRQSATSPTDAPTVHSSSTRKSPSSLVTS